MALFKNVFNFFDGTKMRLRHKFSHFFVLSKKIFKYLKNDKTIFEKDCLTKLTKINQLLAFKHNGFWACMDTIREKKELNKIWKSKQKAWKIWL